MFQLTKANIEQINTCVRSLETYGDLAASEALTRALVAERSGERTKAMFWLKVLEGVFDAESRQTI